MATDTSEASQAVSELDDMRATALHDIHDLRRAQSAIGAPRPGQPQDWQHRIMPKGFVSERDLDPRARDLRICVTSGSWRRIIAGQRMDQVSEERVEPIAYAGKLSAGFAVGGEA